VIDGSWKKRASALPISMRPERRAKAAQSSNEPLPAGFGTLNGFVRQSGAEQAF
jgi:hypothetical protein